MKHISAAFAFASVTLLAVACQAPKEGEPKADDKAGAEAKSDTSTSNTVKQTPGSEAPQEVPVPEDVAAPPADAEKTASGLASKVLQKGTGSEKPKAHDKVTVHYSGWTTDGKMFDSSVTRGRPATFALNRVIPGWTEGLQLMVEGEKRRFWIPANLAYGETPRRPGAPAGQLTFDVELISVERMPEPPPMPEVPKDVKAPPKDAKKTASGLAYQVIENKDGGKKPTAASRVTVHYTGWTTDGKVFDSSIPRGEPATFPLGGVIKGWTEGLQLMDEGDTYLFWIPADLAYGETPSRPGAPAGMLVFQVTLISVAG